MFVGWRERLGGLRTVLLLTILVFAAFAFATSRSIASGQDHEAVLAALVDAGIVDPGVAAEITANGEVEALVQYHDSSVIDAADAEKRRRGLTEDSPEILADKAGGFRAIKAGVRSRGGKNVAVVRDYEHFAIQFLKFESVSALAQTASDPAVRKVTPNASYTTQLAQSLPLVQQPQAALAGRTGAGASVAILDSGLDYTAPHFGCTGVNVPASTCRVAYVQDFAADDGLLDDNGHGTNVAAIASAVAPGAKILGLDVFNGATATDADIIAGLDFAIANQATYNIRAVNLSLGKSTYSKTTCTTSFTPVFASLRAAGIIPVVSSGNRASVSSSFTEGIAEPACTAGALSVGGVYDSTLSAPPAWTACPGATADITTAADQIMCLSQTAPILGMLAPGAMSTAAGLTKGGTSMAAPHVSGAVAVLAAAVPSQTVDQRHTSLVSSGPSILDSRPNPGVSKKRLDICAALVHAGSNCNPAGPSNDNRANATVITSFPALIRQSTVGFTTEAGDPSPTCAQAPGQQSASAWWTFTTTSAGQFSARTKNSSYPASVGGEDTLLAIYQLSGSSLIEVACNEDIDTDFSSALSNVNLQGSTTYFLAVTGWFTTGGGYLVLNASFTASAEPTTQLQWSLTPSNIPATVPMTDIAVEGQVAGGARNTSDNATEVTLSLGLNSLLGEDDPSPRITLTSGTPTTVQLHLLRQAIPGASARAAYADGRLSQVTATSGGLTAPSGDSAEEIANRFMGNIAQAAGFGSDSVATLSVQKVDETEATGLTVVGYRQEVAGLPVFDAYAKVGIAPDGRVITFSTTLASETTLASTSANVTADDAIAASEAALGPRATVTVVDEITAALAEDLSPKAQEVAYHDGTTLRRGYMVLLPQDDNYWMTVVDQESGALVYQASLQSHDAPEGLVFAEHPDAGPRTTEPFEGTIPGHTEWVSAGNSTYVCPIGFIPCTIGNNVSTLLAYDGAMGGLFIAGQPDGLFSFPFTNGWATGDGSGIVNDIDATLVNLHYFNNSIHDWLYELGFTESSANFQDNNFGLGGLDSDEVTALSGYGGVTCDIQNSTCRNNANFTTPPDGFNGLMRMYLFDDPVRRDGSLDGDIVVHEYGHGLSNRLIDPVQANGLQGIQSRAMGEGWSDYFAATYFDDDIMGEYVTGNAVRGIRNHRYEGHPWTYGDLCTKHSNGCEEHADGEIWAAALWKMRSNIIDNGGTAATADQLVVDGLKLTPESPSMLDARDAIVLAALVTNWSAYQCAIWEAFADSGMGWSASSLGHNDDEPSEAFDLPDTCAASPEVPVLVCDQPLSQTLVAGLATWTNCKISGTPADTLQLPLVATASSTGLTTLASPGFTVSNPAYDATCNGNVDATDALAVLRQLAGFSNGLLPVAPCTGNPTGGELELLDARAIRFGLTTAP